MKRRVPKRPSKCPSPAKQRKRAALNARLATFEGQPVSHHQVRDAIHGVLDDMSVAREGVAITVDWWPAEMRLEIWARPEHATVARVAEGLQVLPDVRESVPTGGPAT